MTQVIIASNNQGKIAEFRDLLGVDFKPLSEMPDPIEVEETGTTFHANARLKAETIAERYGNVTLADDSGLVVDALDGKPGVYSARYAGEEKNDRRNLEKVLSELKGVPKEKRTARFYCVIALSIPGGTTHFATGTCEGYIIHQPTGTHGFGYDPIFYVPEQMKTLAELTSDQKNKISHRAEAMQDLKKHWQEWMEG